MKKSVSEKRQEGNTSGMSLLPTNQCLFLDASMLLAQFAPRFVVRTALGDQIDFIVCNQNLANHRSRSFGRTEWIGVIHLDVVIVEKPVGSISHLRRDVG